MDENRKQQIYKSMERYKRIPLDVKKEDYPAIKAAADAAGLSVNTYIRRAIAEQMERDKEGEK